jgi:hypothetical protein
MRHFPHPQPAPGTEKQYKKATVQVNSVRWLDNCRRSPPKAYINTDLQI